MTTIIVCVWFRGQWWYAVTLGWAIFAVGAAGVHLHEMSGTSNNGSLNAGSVLPDLIVPVLLVVLLVVRWRLGAVGTSDAGVTAGA